MFETITFSSSTYEVSLTITPDAISRAVDDIINDNIFSNDTEYDDSFEYFLRANLIEDDDGNEFSKEEIDDLILAAYWEVSVPTKAFIRRCMRRDFLTKMDETWGKAFDN